MMCRLRAERRARGKKSIAGVNLCENRVPTHVGTRRRDVTYDYGQVAAIILTADTARVRALLADAPAALRPPASGLVAVAPAAPLVAPAAPEAAAAGFPVT